ncbi:MAG: SIMPL domain-containing protein [Nanoarchaeota archaeon]
MKKQNTTITITAIVSAVVLIIALSALFMFKPVSSENTVSVEGMAIVKAMPDEIGVYFNIETKGNTSSEAKDANSDILEKLVATLGNQGFGREDIITENYNIYPDYDWTEGKRIDKGFKAIHSIKVMVDSEETDKLGKIIDAGVDAGAGISYINFELSQESQNKYKAEAIKLAAEDAKTKAESVAIGFDKKVGKLVSVNVNDFGYYPWRLYSSSGVTEGDVGLAKEAVSSIQPGEKEVSARVTAVYKII